MEDEEEQSENEKIQSRMNRAQHSQQLRQTFLDERRRFSRNCSEQLIQRRAVILECRDEKRKLQEIDYLAKANVIKERRTR